MKGNCFEVHGRMMLNSETEFEKKLGFTIGPVKLVHGEVTGTGPAVRGFKYGHAWLEDNVMCYDFSNGDFINIPKFQYYSLGNIKNKEGKLFKYTDKEAREKMLETGHFGSWELTCEL